ncbi:MAG: hypothetical protein PHF00_04155, partial [Elusimicrobia bacterium]|nr:hypothetical protein [Elusimicrobiota bacterium]
MARYFKKRRKNSGPNKNEEKVMRAAEARSQGGFASSLPGVLRLRLNMRFLSPQSQLLDEKNLNLGPSDACSFEVACPGRCGSGVFDFSEAAANAARARQPAM